MEIADKDSCRWENPPELLAGDGREKPKDLSSKNLQTFIELVEEN